MLLGALHFKEVLLLFKGTKCRDLATLCMESPHTNHGPHLQLSKYTRKKYKMKTNKTERPQSGQQIFMVEWEYPGLSVQLSHLEWEKGNKW